MYCRGNIISTKLGNALSSATYGTAVHYNFNCAVVNPPPLASLRRRQIEQSASPPRLDSLGPGGTPPAKANVETLSFFFSSPFKTPPPIRIARKGSSPPGSLSEIGSSWIPFLGGRASSDLDAY